MWLFKYIYCVCVCACVCVCVKLHGTSQNTVARVPVPLVLALWMTLDGKALRNVWFSWETLFRIYLQTLYVDVLTSFVCLLGEKIPFSEQNGWVEAQRRVCNGEFWGEAGGHDIEMGGKITWLHWCLLAIVWKGMSLGEYMTWNLWTPQFSTPWKEK